jgi:uncharacterized membrane protein (DUF373 family)
MSFLGRLCVMARWPKRVNLLDMLSVFEHIIYFFVALALIVPIALLFGSMVMSTLRVSEMGVLETVLAVLDRVLLVFIFVELLDTIRIIIRERGIVIAGPFLLVGLIAVVRRILLVTAGLEQAAGTEEFQSLLLELGVMAGLVVVLTGALYFTGRLHRSEQASEGRSS